MDEQKSLPDKKIVLLMLCSPRSCVPTRKAAYVGHPCCSRWRSTVRNSQMARVVLFVRHVDDVAENRTTTGCEQHVSK